MQNLQWISQGKDWATYREHQPHTVISSIPAPCTQELSAVCALSGSAVSSSLWPHELQPARLLCSWDSPGKNTISGLPFPPLGYLPDPGRPCLSWVSCIGRQILYHWATGIPHNQVAQVNCMCLLYFLLPFELPSPGTSSTFPKTGGSFNSPLCRKKAT